MAYARPIPLESVTPGRVSTPTIFPGGVGLNVAVTELGAEAAPGVGSRHSVTAEGLLVLLEAGAMRSIPLRCIPPGTFAACWPSSLLHP